MKLIVPKYNFTKLLVALLAIGTSSISIAQSCDTYPYQPLENIVEFDGGGNFKLLSTGAASVDFDDPSEVMSARREAELIAKRSIAEYINQKFSSEDSISSEITKSKTNNKATDGSIVSSAQRDEVKKQLTSISTRADALLKGVLSIGSCYTKGHEVRVTVGIKSQTIANAENLGKTMGADKASAYPKKSEKNSQQNSDANAQGESNAQTKSDTKNYDGSKQLNKF